MRLLAALAVAFVAILHLLFLILESFLWTKPVGRRVFALSEELAQSTKALAANQGLYNGFLAAGLIWGLVDTSDGFRIQLFFLICVIVAGIVGAATAKRSILFVQALPAAIATALLFAAHR